MDVKKLTEGKRIRYTIKHRLGETTGKGKVVQVYPTVTGTRVVIFDKENNRSVTARPSQIGSV